MTFKGFVMPSCLIMAMVVAACADEKKEASPTCNDGLQNGLETGVDCGADPCKPCMDDFRLISSTDANGQPMSNPDPADWTTDEVWLDAEYELFGLSATSPQQLADGAAIALFPNPVEGAYFQLRIEHPKLELAQLRMVFVKEDFERISLDLDNPAFSSDGIDFALSKENVTQGQFSTKMLEGVQAGEFVRMYYLLWSENTIRMKGHGDFLLK